MNTMEQLSKFPTLLKEALPSFIEQEKDVQAYATFTDRMYRDSLDHYVDFFADVTDVTAYVEGTSFVIESVCKTKRSTYTIDELN